MKSGSSSGGTSGVSSSTSGQNQTLRQGSDYLQLSQDIWLLLHSIYGGGPEVAIRANGIVNIIGNRNADGGGQGMKPSLPALSTRLRARSVSTSEHCETGSVQHQTSRPKTRSKAKSSHSESGLAEHGSPRVLSSGDEENE